MTTSPSFPGQAGASFVRVRVVPPDAKAFTARLEVVRDDARLLIGYEVDQAGSRIDPPDADQRLRVIAKDLIVKRQPMRLNLHYGELEDA